MNGFRAELFDKIVGLNGHAIVQGYEGRLTDWQQIADSRAQAAGSDVRDAADRAAADGLRQRAGRRRARARNAARRTSAATRSSPGTSSPATSRRSRRAATASPSARASPRRSAPILGSEISLISPEGRSTAVGTVPRIVSYTVGAVFEVGVYDYDKAFVVMPMQDAQTLLMLGDEVGMIEVQTTTPTRSREILAPLEPLRSGQGRHRRLAADELGPVRGAGDRARGDVRRAVADRRSSRCSTSSRR